jgi:hypothetical protein
MSNLNTKVNREIQRKLKAGHYQTVSTNPLYDKFKRELTNHFNTHNFSIPFTNISVYPNVVTGSSLYVNNQISKKNNVDVKLKMSDETIKIFHKNLCDITIIPHPKGIELFRIEMYITNKGYGSLFMKAFTDISKRNNIPIFLTIGTPGSCAYNSNRNAQLRFYKRFGFKRCKDSDYYSNEK